MILAQNIQEKHVNMVVQVTILIVRANASHVSLALIPVQAVLNLIAIILEPLAIKDMVFIDMREQLNVELYV